MKVKILFLLALVLITVNTLYADNKTITGMVIGQTVNLRSEPGWATTVITVLNSGLLVKVLEISDQWYRVKLSDDREGWVYKDYITMQSSRVESRTRFLAKAQELTNFAKSYLGAKYCYGGSSPVGFDCSGYTMYVYARFGYKLPHSALSQMSMGEKVNRGDLDLGDLVFFSTTEPSSINHVGIYLGQGDFIHASSGYQRIKVNSLDESYYNTRYRGARRMLNNMVI
jgi:cell wall-associated NlpC family hydrolase